MENNQQIKYPPYKILLISTGGTIAGEVAENKKDPDYKKVKAEKFSELIKDTVLHINKEQRINLIIEPEEYAELDSSNIKPEHWADLVQIIYDKYDFYDAFIITHGTNTLGYTSAALSFALENNAKRVVLTGSQVPIGVPGSDAKTNLDNAIRIACWKKHPIYGVVAVFGSHIISGTRVKKSTEFDYDAFRSFGTAAIGRIGRIIDINLQNLREHNEYWDKKNSIYPIATTQKRLEKDNRFDPHIVSLTEFPGMDPNIFQKLVINLQIKGFILRAFGAGDASSSLIPALEFLKEQKIPIVITTQAPNGNANMQVNEPGQYIFHKKLGIPAYDMSIESQTTKLAWLLARVEAREITYEQLCTEMNHNIKGEVNIIHEDEWPG